MNQVTRLLDRWIYTTLWIALILYLAAIAEWVR